MFKAICLLVICNLSFINAFAMQVNENEKFNINKKFQLSFNEVLEDNLFKKVGSAKFSYLLWDVYESELMTSSGQYPLKNDDEELIYKITYLRNISAVDLVDETKKQWQHLGVQNEIYESYLIQLKKMWPNINNKDTLAFYYTKNGSAFYHNGQYIGQFNDKHFAMNFLDIWLSTKTSEPQLRKQLLGEP